MTRWWPAEAAPEEDGGPEPAEQLEPSPLSEPVVRMGQAAVEIPDWDGRAVVTLWRDGDSSQPLTVRLAARDGSAVAGVHYRLPAAGLEAQFGPGASSAVLELPLERDAATVADVSWTVELSTPGEEAGYTVSALARCVCTIRHTEFEGPTVEWSEQQVEVLENEGYACLQMRRNGELSQPLSVPLRTVEGVGLHAGRADYDFVPGEYIAEFTPGEATTVVEVSILDDEEIGKEHKPDRHFEVWIEPAEEYRVVRSASVAVTVQDADFRGRGWVHEVVDATAFKVIMLVFTFYALVGTDIWILTVDYDQGVDDFETALVIITIAAFCFEIVAMCIVYRADYCPSTSFVMDFVAMAAMVLMLPWIRQYVVFDASLARVNRVGKVAARASRAVKCGAIIGKCFKLATGLWSWWMEPGEMPQIKAIRLAELSEPDRIAETDLMSEAERGAVFVFGGPEVRATLLGSMQPKEWLAVLGPQSPCPHPLTGQEKAEIYLYARPAGRAALIALAAPSIRREAFEHLSADDKIAVLVRMNSAQRAATAIGSPSANGDRSEANGRRAEDWKALYAMASLTDKARLLTLFSDADRVDAVREMTSEQRRKIVKMMHTTYEEAEEHLDESKKADAICVAATVFVAMDRHERKKAIPLLGPEEKHELEEAMKQIRRAHQGEASHTDGSPMAMSPSGRVWFGERVMMEQETVSAEDLAQLTRGLGGVQDNAEQIELGAVEDMANESCGEIAAGVEARVQADDELNPHLTQVRAVYQSLEPGPLCPASAQDAQQAAGPVSVQESEVRGQFADGLSSGPEVESSGVEGSGVDSSPAIGPGVGSGSGMEAKDSLDGPADGNGVVIEVAEGGQSGAKGQSDELVSLVPTPEAKEAADAKIKADKRLRGHLAQQQEAKDKADLQMIDDVGHIGAVLLQQLATKVIVLMILTMLIFALLSVDPLPTQQTYGLDALLSAEQTYSASSNAFTLNMQMYKYGYLPDYSGSPGSKYNKKQALLYLKINGVLYNSGLDTDQLDNRRDFDELVGFVPSDGGCSFSPASLKEDLMSSSCATAAIWDYKDLAVQAAWFNIIAVVLIVVLILLGLAAMASDFHDLMARPAGAMFAVTVLVQAIIKRVEGLIADLKGNDKVDDQGNIIVAEPIDVADLANVIGMEYQEIHRTLIQLVHDSEVSFSMRLPAQRNAITRMHSKVVLLQARLQIWSENEDACRKELVLVLESFGILPPHFHKLMEQLGALSTAFEPRDAEPTTPRAQRMVEELVIDFTTKALGDTAQLIKQKPNLSDLIKKTTDIPGLVNLLRHVHQEAVAQALDELGDEISIPPDFFPSDPNPSVLMEKTDLLLSNCGSPRSIAALQKLKESRLEQVMDNLDRATSAHGVSGAADSLTSEDAVAVLANMLKADTLLPPGFLSVYDKRMMEALLEFVKNGADDGDRSEEGARPYSAAKVTSWIRLANSMVLKNSTFEPGLFGRADKWLVLFTIALAAPIPNQFATRRQHLNHQVKVFADDPEFFPNGRPEQLLQALQRIEQMRAEGSPFAIVIQAAREVLKSLPVDSTGVVCTVTLSMENDSIPAGSAERSSFELQFRSDIAFILGIAAEDVCITDIAEGPVAVTFEVSPNTNMNENSVATAFSTEVLLPSLNVSTKSASNIQTCTPRGAIKSLDAICIEVLLAELDNVEKNGLDALSIDGTIAQVMSQVGAELQAAGPTQTGRIVSELARGVTEEETGN